MEILFILKVLLRRWYLVVVPVVVAAVFVVPDLIGNTPAVSGGFTTVMRYTAAQQLEAIPNRDGDYQDVWLASELTVNAFTEWVRTFRFAQEVAQMTLENGLEIDPAALPIAADNERSIGQIFISWANAEELEIIADAAIEVLQTRNQDYFPQLGDAPAQVQLLDEPRISPVPPSLPNRLLPLIQLLLAGAAGLGLVFAAEYFDTTLRDRRELESLGISVVVSVPKE